MRGSPLLGLALTLTLAPGCRDRELVVFPSTFSDVYVQEPVREVDVLLIIDSSGSMGGEQEKLSVEFQSFIEAFLTAEVDYHIGVVTTDVADVSEAGRLRSATPGTFEQTPPPQLGETPAPEGGGGAALPPEIITPDTQDAESVFADLVRVGTVGSGFEMGLEAARLALSEPLLSGANAGFYRADANLALVVFSDEDDLSPRSVDSYLNFFSELKGGDVYRNASRLTLSSVVGDAPYGCAVGEGDDLSTADPGFRYIDAAQRTDGVFRSICAEDYAPVVAALSLDISGLKDTFSLTYCARQGTLEVTVDGAPQVEGDAFEYLPSERAIRFAAAQIPPPRSEIHIDYEFLPESRYTCPEG